MIRPIIRRLAMVMALPLLGCSLAGCNVVISDHPWFTAGANDPKFSPGLWVALQNDACTFDAAASLASWPDCAKPFFVRGAELLSLPEAKEGQPPIDPAVFGDLAKWKANTPVLVAGQPMVLQLRADVMPTNGGGDPAPSPTAGAANLFLYLAVRAVSSDPGGALQVVRVWPVFCGPPPPPPAKGAVEKLENIGSSAVSRKPFPGLHPAKVGCEAANAAAIQKAAGLSEGVAAANEMAPFTARWLRATLAP